MTISTLKEGSGVKATILVEGRPVTFVLAIFRKPALFSTEKDSFEYEYGYVSEK
jgi:hypothetical protein